MSDEVVDNLLSRLESSYAQLREKDSKIQYCRRALRDDTGDFQVLSDSFELPLEVGGVAITEGTFNGVSYSADVLKENYKKLEGAPLTVDHPVDFKEDDLGVMDKIGKVTKATWNEEKQGVEWKGEIVDEELARRVFHDLADAVSVGVNKVSGNVKNNEVKDIKEFKELSIVSNPACKEATIETLSKILDVETSNNDSNRGEKHMGEEDPEVEEPTEGEVEEYSLFIKKNDKYYPVPEELLGPKKGYGYGYPALDESELADIEERLETLEESVKDILGKLDEDTEEEEVDPEELAEELAESLDKSTEEIVEALGLGEEEKGEREEELEEKVSELEEKIEDLTGEPEERTSEPTDGEGDTEQLSKDDLHKGISKVLQAQE